MNLYKTAGSFANKQTKSLTKTGVNKLEYLVKGCNTCKFLITPDELQEILKNCHLVKYTAHVPIEYTETKLDDYIDVYRQLYELLTCGVKFEWGKHHILFESTGLSSDLKRCTYGHIHTYRDQKYKLADFAEPPVNLAPNALLPNIDDTGKLHINSGVSYLKFPEYYIGMEISYPKNIQYSVGNDFEPPKPTTQLASFKDYENLKAAIKAITKPLTLKTAADKRRTSVYISPRAKNDLKNSYAFGKFLD